MKTGLNCLPLGPSTFSPISALRIGFRWYSHANARRTSLLAISSSPSPCVATLLPLPKFSSSEGFCVRRRWVSRSGELPSSTYCEVKLAGYRERENESLLHVAFALVRLTLLASVSWSNVKVVVGVRQLPACPSGRRVRALARH